MAMVEYSRGRPKQEELRSEEGSSQVRTGGGEQGPTGRSEVGTTRPEVGTTEGGERLSTKKSEVGTTGGFEQKSTGRFDVGTTGEQRPTKESKVGTTDGEQGPASKSEVGTTGETLDTEISPANSVSKILPQSQTCLKISFSWITFGCFLWP